MQICAVSPLSGRRLLRFRSEIKGNLLQLRDQVTGVRVRVHHRIDGSSTQVGKLQKQILAVGGIRQTFVQSYQPRTNHSLYFTIEYLHAIQVTVEDRIVKRFALALPLLNVVAGSGSRFEYFHRGNAPSAIRSRDQAL